MGGGGGEAKWLCLFVCLLVPYYSEMQCGEGVKWFCLCVCRAGGGGVFFWSV